MGSVMRGSVVAILLVLAACGCGGDKQEAPQAAKRGRMRLVCMSLDLARRAMPFEPKVTDLEYLAVGERRSWFCSSRENVTGTGASRGWRLSYDVLRLDEQDLRAEVCLAIHGGPEHTVASSLRIEPGQASTVFVPSGEQPRFAAVFVIISD